MGQMSLAVSYEGRILLAMPDGVDHLNAVLEGHEPEFILVQNFFEELRQ